MCHPINKFALECLGAVHSGIIQHHDDECVRGFMCRKMIKGFYNGLGGHVVKKLTFPDQKAQYIQPFAVWVGRDFPGLGYRAPCIRK